MENKLVEAYPDFLSGAGIFSDFASMPWGVTPTAQELDTLFFSDYGNRPQSPLIRTLLLASNTTVLSAQQRKAIADIISAKFKTNWQKLYSVMTASYTPLSTVDIHESESLNGTDAVEKNETETDSSNAETNSQGSVFAFDSTTATPSNSDTVSTESGNTRSTDYNDITTLNHDREKTRTGIEGGITYQDLLQKEMNIWKWNFFSEMMNDVASITTLSIFYSK